MIPKKMDVIRKSYSDWMKGLIMLLGDHLARVDFSNAADASWSMVFHVGKRLTSLEQFQISHELADAGWGCSVRIRSVTEDSLVVYIRLN